MVRRVGGPVEAATAKAQPAAGQMPADGARLSSTAACVPTVKVRSMPGEPRSVCAKMSRTRTASARRPAIAGLRATADRALVTGHPSLRPVVVPDASHNVAAEAPDLVRSLLREQLA